VSDIRRTLRGAWAPQPGPQTDALSATWCNELFYGGAAGGGKSDLLLGDFLQDVPTYGEAWQGVIFRRTYPELEELMGRAHDIFPSTGATWNEVHKTYRWPNGAWLKFRYLEQERHRQRYQGHQYTWIGWDELTQWATDKAYRYLRARLRSPHDVPTKRIRSAANPGGPGHHWVRSYFVNPAPGGYEVLEDRVTQMSRMFVPARLTDNLILVQADPGYAARLRGLGSEALVRAWLDGDWNIVEGAFFDCWSEKMILPPVELPKDWLRFRSADWGSASPFSIGWWAVVQDDWRHPRTKQTLPRGALVRYREWYGSKDPAADGSKGLKLMADQVGRGIVSREKSDPKLSYGVLDPSTFKQDGGPPIAEVMNMELINAKLVPFHEADNTRVSRRGSKDRRGPMSGWDQMRSRMVGKLDGTGEPVGKPMVYCFSTCVASIRTIPVLQHDATNPEDLDNSGAEDHAADEWRYACSSRPWLPTHPVPEAPRDGYRDEDEENDRSSSVSIQVL
jgi:hypothetical protein